MEPLVCVIIPVFNAASYIDNAVDSIKKQRYTNWRCILVDDCSTDESAKLCESLAKSNSRFSVISLDANLGPAHARNVGIEIAIENNAKYVAFLDSDDALEDNFLSELVSTIENNKADIVWCNYIEYNFGNRETARRIHHKMSCPGFVKEDLLLSSFIHATSGVGSMCNKLYRLEFIVRNNLRLNEQRVRAEDWEFNLMLFQCSPKVYVIDNYLYDYIHYSRTSVMGAYRENDYEMFWRSRGLLIEMAERYCLPIISDHFDSGFMYNLISYIISLQSYSIKYIINRLHYIQNDERYRQFMFASTRKTLLLPKSYFVFYFLLVWRMILPLAFCVKCRAIKILK